MTKITHRVERTCVIDHHIVEEVTSFGNVTVYKETPSILDTNSDDHIVFYFTIDDIVVKTLVIEADMGQDMGFISRAEFLNH